MFFIGTSSYECHGDSEDGIGSEFWFIWCAIESKKSIVQISNGGKIFFENGVFPTLTDVILSVISLKQPTFAIVYFAVGGAFAAFVFAISVVAVPLMADRKTDAITAALASIVACTKNPLTMLLWGFCIVVLVGFGFATNFVGFIVTMPIAGHASWHVYRAVVEAEKAA